MLEKNKYLSIVAVLAALVVIPIAYAATSMTDDAAPDLSTTSLYVSDPITVTAHYYGTGGGAKQLLSPP